MVWLLEFWITVSLAGPINIQLSEYGLHLEKDSNWSMQNKSGVDKKLQSLELKRDGVSVELKFISGLTSYQAEQETKTEYTSILSAYKAALTPYAGTVSRKMSCPPEFLPKDVRTEFAGQRARVLFGFANDRKSFGVCNMDEAKMEFAFLATTLPGDHLVKLVAFRKKGERRDLDSWKRILAEFKLKPVKGGRANGAKP